MKNPSVCVLMATYNGQLYLRDQIDSIIHQSHDNIKIVISDDGSSDLTKEILAQYKAKYPSKIEIIEGPRNGLEFNFYSLILGIHSFDLYAFADQDDIWEKDKISRAIQYHESFDSDTPFVYCSATVMVDENAHFIQCEKRRIDGRISLNHALGHNIATGNTIVFNEATRVLFPAEIMNINPLGHDWLIFIYVLMFGGEVVYDDRPGVFYRIHASNHSGVKFSIWGRLKLLKKWIFDSKLKTTNRQIIDSIELVSHKASPEIKSIIELFKVAHEGNIFQRIYSYGRIKITRKNKWTNWINWMAVIFGKF